MPLVYSAVARLGTPVSVLAEYAIFAGNWTSVTKDYLSKSANGGRFSYTVDGYVMSFLAEEGYCRCCCATEHMLLLQHADVLLLVLCCTPLGLQRTCLACK